MTDAAPQRELFERARAGDREAAGALVTLHAPWILGWFRARGLSAGEAEDLAQDTFLVLFHELDAVRVPERLAAWLRGVCTNVLREYRRRQSHRKTVPMEDALPHETDSPSDQHFALRRAIGQLDPDLAQVLFAYYTRPLSYEQVADLLGLSRATVQSRLRRGLAALRGALGASSRKDRP